LINFTPYQIVINDCKEYFFKASLHQIKEEVTSTIINSETGGLNFPFSFPFLYASTDSYKSHLKNNAIFQEKSNILRDLYEPVYLMYILLILLDE